ncbi:metabolite traffic protein EboE [Actinokineospora sp. UTMC 2448]|uniref:metabolite traffic protein EboE n=1 Tax=Actinokineospora sp. UTMC 2448 TaxID=2268449 RepID=UPI0021643247|nr:metabolite traffic protein EboE [Actinokineospora sp. UTMC 2448]UVS81966.1 Xylose isomerase-like TIM barrel [Actinokineospora sp. UTMC 2448]
MTISYCTNVHPAETVAGIIEQLDRFSVPIREELGADVLGLGLWLSAPAARQLAADPAVRRGLRRELDARGLVVHTLNAFPYRGFHEPVVKHSVYHPRWTEKARLDYTRDCATVLATLLPDDAEHGSISTLPLGWRTEWTPADDSRATAALAELTEYLARLSRPIRLAVEPEPGCVLDTMADAVGWLAGRVDPEQIGVCLDTCHLAVSFADPAETVRLIAEAGLRVYKVQASAALEAPAGHADALARFIEPRYLHQVRALKDGVVHAADDLPAAYGALPADAPWRVHFHVPLHAEPDAPLATTTGVLREAVAALDTPAHIEVETYTWSVLPDFRDHRLVEGIAAELRWAAHHLEGVRA